MFENPQKWTLRKLVQNTYYYDRKRFRSLDMSSSIVSVVVEKQTVSHGLHDESPTTVYDIHTVSSSGSPVTYVGLNGKTYPTGRRYGEVEIRLARLSVDEDRIELRASNGKKIDLTRRGNEYVNLRTMKRLTPSEASKTEDKAETFLLDRPLLSLIRLLVDSGILT